jgi:opacity protein-like surface antigen
MNKTIHSVAGAVAVLIATCASGKAATPMAPATGASWSGLYLDGAFGWEWSKNTWTFNSPFLAVANETPVGAPFTNSANDAVLGFHIGYQQQFGWLVVGGEFGALGQLSNHFASSTPSVASPGSGVPPCGILVGVVSTCQSRIGSVMTAGGKLGYANGDWLAYGVGGAAFNAAVEAQIMQAGFPDTGTGGKAHGYYVGGGIDYNFAKTSFADFIIGVEYEHVGLNAAQVCSALSGGGFTGGNPCNQPSAPSIFQRTISAQQDVFWGKVTVKFNPFGL